MVSRSKGIIATRLFGRRRVAMKVVGDLIWEKARNARATQLDLDEFQRASCRCDGVCCDGCRAYTPGLRNCVIVPSAYLGAIVRGWGVDPAKIRVIHNAAPLPPPGPVEPRYDLITVARLVPWKGIAELIEVAAATAGACESLATDR